MIRFYRNHEDPLYFALLKLTQSEGSSEITQEVLYADDSSSELPNLSVYSVPQKQFNSTTEAYSSFIFYLKTTGLYPTYGYVVQSILNNERTVYCILSPFYNPEIIFSTITQYLSNASQDVSAHLAKNLHPPIQDRKQMIHSENKIIISNIKTLLRHFDPEFIGRLILYLVLDYRFVISSSNTELLSNFVFSLLSLIYPLSWPGVFISVLPDSMSEITLAPFPFIIGVHSSLLSQLDTENMESHVHIDIDNKSMESFGDIQLPSKISDILNKFKKEIYAAVTDPDVDILCETHKLIINVISIGLCGKLVTNPEKLYQKWDKYRNKNNIQPLQKLVAESQTVLQLMREIELKEESEIYNDYWFRTPINVSSVVTLSSVPSDPTSEPREGKKLLGLFKNRSTTISYKKTKKVLPKESSTHNPDQDSSSSSLLVQVQLRGSSQCASSNLLLKPDDDLSPITPTETPQPERKSLVLEILESKQEKNRQSSQYRGLCEVEELASLFASKFQNGGIIDPCSFKKGQFRTNAGIEDPEALSFKTKLKLYQSSTSEEFRNSAMKLPISIDLQPPCQLDETYSIASNANIELQQYVPDELEENKDVPILVDTANESENEMVDTQNGNEEVQNESEEIDTKSDEVTQPSDPSEVQLKPIKKSQESTQCDDISIPNNSEDNSKNESSQPTTITEDQLMLLNHDTTKTTTDVPSKSEETTSNIITAKSEKDVSKSAISHEVQQQSKTPTSKPTTISEVRLKPLRNNDFTQKTSTSKSSTVTSKSTTPCNDTVGVSEIPSKSEKFTTNSASKTPSEVKPKFPVPKDIRQKSKTETSKPTTISEVRLRPIRNNDFTQPTFNESSKSGGITSQNDQSKSSETSELKPKFALPKDFRQKSQTQTPKPTTISEVRLRPIHNYSKSTTSTNNNVTSLTTTSTDDPKPATTSNVHLRSIDDSSKSTTSQSGTSKPTKIGDVRLKPLRY